MSSQVQQQALHRKGICQMSLTQTSRPSRMKMDSLMARFMDEFSFNLAITPFEKERVYRLRYEVYCDELGYEKPADSSNKLEYDVYDQHSIHCLIEHRRTGTRSEEHTSELQSRPHLVCRLLLEKKKETKHRQQ